MGLLVVIPGITHDLIWSLKVCLGFKMEVIVPMVSNMLALTFFFDSPEFHKL